MEESILMWNRLEGSMRNENQLDNALRFEIRDALWMLTRQWQFGELDGEDAATAAFVQVSGQQSPVKGVGGAGQPVQPFDFSNSPLELPLEREVFVPDIADRLEMGRHWERMLRKRLPAAPAKTAIQKFRTNIKFQFNTPLPAEPNREDRFQHAQHFADENRLMMIESLAGGRALDGYALLRELQGGKAASVFLPQSDAAVNAAGKEFLQWFEKVYGQTTSAKNTWHAQHLEYQPQLAFHDTNGNTQTLRKEEYYGDGIKWHGFAPKPVWDEQNPPTLPVNMPASTTETVIPSGVRFRGMPSKRLWEMEDSQVDFGSIRAASTELSKMLFAEFGLVYGNDWLVAPVQFNCGSLCRIATMVVTDIFGKATVLKEIEPDKNWAFFQTQGAPNDKRWLFLANDAGVTEESKPIEKISFLRDEMANMVWGVEEIISNPFGGGRDGETLAKQTAQLINTVIEPPPPATSGKLSSEGWVYKAGTMMAENRIPFIPVATTNSQAQVLGKRTVVLQRAATPRVADGFTPVRIRPRTRLLGYNGKPENEKPDPLFIFEEEVPRTGMELSLIWKRARWLNGQTFTWLARKKKVGKGEIDANFRFDTLKK